MGEKHSKQPSTPKSDQPTVEVCDICGDFGDLELILTCPKCKISREHVYCQKVLTINILDGWCCDICEGERLSSHKNMNQNSHNTLASNPSGYACDEGPTSAIKSKHRLVEKMVNKGKVKCITPQEAMILSSGTRKGEKVSKTIKHFNSSPLRIERPMYLRTLVHQKGLPLNSPVASIPLPENKQNNSVIQQGRLKSQIPRAVNPAVGTILGSSGKDKSMSGEASIARSREKLFQQSINSDIHAVETKFASMRRGMSVPKEIPFAPSLKKQFIQPSTSVVDTKVASTGKEAGVSTEGSCAPSLGQYQQQSASVTPAIETKLVTMRKEKSVPKEAPCAPSRKKQFMQPSTSVKVVVEAKVLSTGKDATVPIEGSCPPSPEHYLQQSTSGHQISSDLDPRVSDVENCKLVNVEPKAEKFSRGPALDSLWKGQFKILGKSFQNFNFEFEARPSCRASRKVLNCSKRMPQVLQFSLIRRKMVWRTFFKDDCPDEDDIGLYFCSGDNDEGSNYDWVLTFIEALDLALRCNISGVELYLFTSKTLSADHQTWNGEHFLWGLLRKIGKHKDVSKLYEDLPPVVHQPLDSSQNNDIDMEIDMLAGNNVGKTDIAVPRDSSCVANSSVGHVKSFPLQDIKKEPLLDCPPGFEEIYRLKVQKIDFS